MEFLALLAGALLAILLVTLLFRTEARRPPAPTLRPVEGRVGDLCDALTGDPVRDRAMLNRLLALGPGIVPDLLEAITALVRSPDGVEPTRLARLEELVADFGLAAVPTVTDALIRLQPTAPVSPSMLRILDRLGPAGVAAVLRRGLDQPELAPFLPRFRGVAGAALVQVLRERPAGRRESDLTRLAGLLAVHPSAIEALYDAWPPEGRAALLVWLAGWLPLVDPALVGRALSDEHPAPRAAAARLVRLLADPRLLLAVGDLLDDPDPRVRVAAAAALASHPRGDPGALLLRAAADPEPAVAGVAVCGLVTSRAESLTDLRVAAGGLPKAASALLEAAGGGDPQAALAVVDGGGDPVTLDLAVRLLGRAARDDPRARERLIRMADSDALDERVDAVRALSESADTTVAEI